MEKFRVVNNDGSYDSDVVAIVKGDGLHMGLTVGEAYRLRDALDRKLRDIEAAWRRKGSKILKRLQDKADAGKPWTQRDADTWREYTSVAFPASVVVKSPRQRTKKKAGE
jgi:hypothetical protein